MARPKHSRKTSLSSGLKKSAHLTVSNDGAHEMVVVPIADLKVDLTYQRKPNQRRIDKIARAYDMGKAGVIEVSRRVGGHLFVMDGWHRVLAANLASEEEMLAHIHVGLTVEQEADIFRSANKRLPIKALEDFKAALAEGDTEDGKEARDINRVVGDMGGWVGEAQGDREKGAIIAIAALQKIYRNTGGTRGGAEGLRRALSLLRDAYGSLEGDAVHGDLMKGVSAFVETYTDGVNFMFKRPRLVRRMQEVGIDALLQQARSFQTIYGGALWVNIARSLVPIYNTGLAHLNRVPEWGARPAE